MVRMSVWWGEAQRGGSAGDTVRLALKTFSRNNFSSTGMLCLGKALAEVVGIVASSLCTKRHYTHSGLRVTVFLT